MANVNELAQFYARCGAQGLTAKEWRETLEWNVASNAVFTVRDGPDLVASGITWAISGFMWDQSREWWDQEFPSELWRGNVLYISHLAIDTSLVKTVKASKDIFNGIVSFGKYRFPWVQKFAYHRKVGENYVARGWEFKNGRRQ